MERLDGGKSNGLGLTVKPVFTARTASAIKYFSCPTQMSPEWLNMVQEEISRAIELSGSAVDGADDEQLFKAIQDIADARIALNAPAIVHVAQTQLVLNTNTPVGFTNFAIGTPPSGAKSIGLNSIFNTTGDDGTYDLRIRDTNGLIFNFNGVNAFDNAVGSSDQGVNTWWFDITGGSSMAYEIIDVFHSGANAFTSQINRVAWH